MALFSARFLEALDVFVSKSELGRCCSDGSSSKYSERVLRVCWESAGSVYVAVGSIER